MTEHVAGTRDSAPRMASLDVLRGVAILGILFMNINEMGGSIWASWSDPRHFGWSAADRVIWSLRELYAEGTARCLLELLFGAGMMVLADRYGAADEEEASARYRRRMLVLLALGGAHMFILLWPGDILHTYALAALIAFPFRRLSPRMLLALGLLMTVLDLGAGVAGALDLRRDRAVTHAHRPERPVAQAREGAERAQSARDRRVRIAAEDRARAGDATSWAAAAWAAGWTVLSGGELSSIREAWSTILIGAALFRLGVIQGKRSRLFYAGLAVLGYGAGLPLRMAAVEHAMRFDGTPTFTDTTHDLARLATTLGHIGLIHLLLGSVLGAKLLRPFVAAGRTALSIYVAQTLICLWLLYPPFMLGLYGTQGWAELMTTALGINIGLLIGANWWVRRYPIAPVEWAWRSLAEGRRLPFRERPGAATMPA